MIRSFGRGKSSGYFQGNSEDFTSFFHFSSNLNKIMYNLLNGSEQCSYFFKQRAIFIYFKFSNLNIFVSGERLNIFLVLKL